MQKDNYWVRRLTGSRLSRRRFVGGTAAIGAGAAGLALVGCGDDDDDEGDGTPASPTATTGSGETPGATTAPTVDPNAPQSGGTINGSTAGNTWDTFDIDRTVFSPTAVLMNYTNDGFLSYRDFESAELQGELAESWEVVDDTTITFKLRKNAVWDKKPPVDGRAVTVEDLAYHITRNKEAKLVDGTPDDLFKRSSSYQTVDKVDVTDAETLTVTFTRPDPFFIAATLAGPYAKVQAPEAVAEFEDTYDQLEPDKIIGTSAFVLDTFDPSGEVSWKRNPLFWGEPAWVDGIFASNLISDQAAAQAAWEQKQIDSFTPSSIQVRDDLAKTYEGKAYIQRSFGANPHAGGYFGGAEPWSNKNLIGALYRVLDRRLLLQQLLGGAGVLAGNVPPTQTAFALSEDELFEFPGYLEDHEKDIAEAKAMWDAGGGADLGPITIDVADIWEGRYRGVSESLQSMYGQLGNEVVMKIEPYSTIIQKITTNQYGGGNAAFWHGWITDVQGPEATLDVYTKYNSKGGQFFQFGVKMDEVDKWTDEAIVEFDAERRIELIKDSARKIIENYGAGEPYIEVALTNTLYWNYYHVGKPAAFITSQNLYQDNWFDQNDPTWEGRTA